MRLVFTSPFNYHYQERDRSRAGGYFHDCQRELEKLGS